MIKVGIFGATGRIGKLLIEALFNDNEAKLFCVFVRNELQYSIPKGVLVTNDIKVFLESSDLIIDFSSPEATQILLDCAIDECNKPIVIGTTGLNDMQKDLLVAASLKMPILYSSNMSRGIVVLNNISKIVSNVLRDSDIEITEIHHKHKKDSPSGTALSIANNVAKARGLDISKVRVSGRDGIIGERSKDEIAVMSLRGGDVVGKHTVGFYMDGEYIEITHNATSRMTFAKGAINIGKWLINQKNGLYNIEDALTL
ncbi:4-hydroxy-tetrahydrodipicolinate reductase [Helicobacter sp. MIT 14-3879]|uniref:4-hydroxy-tetrahydrodipicolinate reductase n=1 Tax=Helicobacter sp. MIT 14-3879 TaxID=2040649 RepID=UPI000E1E800D|nr:4-hydroxy-tetrahydrodipicolinate reductase [Helicobacter sp. MIT 14-3879]RDU63146.1 4-hydroxy-tetrahydrodipicolinate reductase [Helicobacter sp. MIT 14-3879]